MILMSTLTKMKNMNGKTSKWAISGLFCSYLLYGVCPALWRGPLTAAI